MINVHDLVKAQAYVNKLQLKRAKETAESGTVTDTEINFDNILSNLSVAVMELNLERVKATKETRQDNLGAC